MKYLKSLLFSVFLVSNLTAIYAQRIAVVKNIINNSTSDFIVFSGSSSDSVLEKKLINASTSEISAFLQTVGNSITVLSGQTKTLNEQILFKTDDVIPDKQLYFINNSTKTLKYLLIVRSQRNNLVVTMIQFMDDIRTWSTGTRNLTIDITIGDNLAQSNIEFR